MENSEALNLAADHIEMYGHRKHGLGRPGEPTCALGAIVAVTDAGDRMGPHWLTAARPLTRYISDDALRACAVIQASRERQPAEVTV